MDTALETYGGTLTSTQKGAIGEAIVGAQLMLASNGRLSPFRSIADDDGTELRFTLRRSSAGRVFLDINRKNYTQSDHYSVHDLKACAAYLERAAQEMRKHLDAVPPA